MEIKVKWEKVADPVNGKTTIAQVAVCVNGMVMYGKFFFSSNTLAVRTPKFIMKLLLTTFSFSSNSDSFHAFEFLILRTLKKAGNTMLELHKAMADDCWNYCQIFSWRHEQREATWAKRGNSIDLNYGVHLGLKAICGPRAKKYFIDVLMFPLFGKISWRKKWLSSVKIKTKSEELECVIFILSFNRLYIVLTGDVGNFICFYQVL